MPTSSKKYGPTFDCAKEWTEATSPLRTLKVPNTASANVTSTSARFHSFSIPRRSCTIAECRNAVSGSSGSNAEFSTGSQPQ